MAGAGLASGMGSKRAAGSGMFGTLCWAGFFLWVLGFLAGGMISTVAGNALTGATWIGAAGNISLVSGSRGLGMRSG